MGEFVNNTKEKKESRLKTLRERRGWSQEFLADIVGCSRVYINKLENQKVANPSITIYKKLAYALSVPLEDLIKDLRV